MGKATGKTFEEFVEGTNALNVFLAQDRISSLGRSADSSDWAIFTKKGRKVLFTIPDSAHEYTGTTGDDFRRYALLCGLYLVQGGTEPFTDPFHDED